MSVVIEQAAETAAAQFEADGLFIAPRIIPPELVERASAHMDAVMACQYETGTPPHHRCWNPGDDPQKIRKIDDAHLSDNTIQELISHPALGRMAAAVTGAKRVQVWATQMLFKPPGGQQTGNVGWHQDRQYWKYWEGEVFTAWVAISDVTPDAGGMRLVRGSHRWGEIEGGNFFGSDLDGLKSAMKTRPDANWEEVPAILPPGGVSFHHHLTVHGSGPNLAAWPRRSFAIHLRTEKSRPVPEFSGNYYVSNLDNPRHCPVIYDART